MMVAITVYPILWRSRKFIDKVCYTGLGLSSFNGHGDQGIKDTPRYIIL